MLMRNRLLSRTGVCTMPAPESHDCRRCKRLRWGTKMQPADAPASVGGTANGLSFTAGCRREIVDQSNQFDLWCIGRNQSPRVSLSSLNAGSRQLRSMTDSANSPNRFADARRCPLRNIARMALLGSSGLDAVTDPMLRNVRREANPDPRPRPDSLAGPSRAAGAFSERNWLEEWTFFGPESAYRAPTPQAHERR